ncbi:MAG TPA: hypothetical protein P5127_04750, partial [Oscillospiraceae bacterium]|nr:hypothetical protein [Oscillospiraceae bacterium]
NNPSPILRELIKNNIQGKIFTNDYLGGSVLFEAYPDLRPLTDSRQVNQEFFFNQYFALSSNPKRNWPVIASHHHLNLVLLDTLVPFSYRLLTYLSQNSDWQLARVHGSLVLFVKKSDIDLPLAWKNFVAELSSTPLVPADVEALKLYLEKPVPKISPFAPKTVYIEPLEEAANLIGLGYPGLGVKRLLALSQKIDYPNIRAVARSALFLLETAEKEKASAQDRQSEVFSSQ